MTEPWRRSVTRWVEAGVLDAEAAARIQAFESQRVGSTRLKWPVWVALGFGAMMIGAGVLLFVSAHWDTLSPAARFATVIALVAAFHLAASVAADRFPAMGSALHAVGTVALGAGIFLAGQIFNLAGDWPNGYLLWAIGALVAWAVLRDGPQLALAATLVPAWLATEWFDATQPYMYVNQERVLSCGAFLLALVYFTAPRVERISLPRRILLRIGGLALIPSGLLMAGMTAPNLAPDVTGFPPFPASLLIAGWIAAIVLPLVVAVVLHRRAAWPLGVAAGWMGALIWIGLAGGREWPLYVWWACGALGLVAWGVQTARTERINMGSVALALTVIIFYFSHVMDKLGRSLSLVGLGVLFLAGGWALERTRRRLVRHARGVAS